MRAHQIMTRRVITVSPDSSIVDAAATMLDNHISGLPVVDANGQLVGICSEGDFIRRAEIGTQRRRNRWLQLLAGPGKAANEFVAQQGRKVGDVMTPDAVTVTEETPLSEVADLMEKRHVKRLPVLRDGRVVGIVTRANLLRAVAALARDVADPTADDDHIRERIIAAIENNDWRPFGLGVTVRNGVVDLHGVIVDEASRKASIVAAENVQGVKQVHDHLCWVDTMSGIYVNSPEDEKRAKQAG